MLKEFLTSNHKNYYNLSFPRKINYLRRYISMNKSIEKLDIVEEMLFAFQNEALRNAVEKEYIDSDDYAPIWITKKESKALDAEVFVEKKKGKLTVYKNLKKDGADAYVTKHEIKSKPEIRNDAENLLDVLEQFKFQIVEFAGKKFIGVRSKYNWKDSRVVLLTKAFQNIVKERYGDSAYVVCNARGLLLVFGAHENPVAIMNDIIESDAYFRENGFEVLLIQKNKLTCVIETYQLFNKFC